MEDDTTPFSYSPTVFKLDEGEGRASAVVEVHVQNLPVLVEEVFQVAGSDVGREVAHVDLTVVVTTEPRPRHLALVSDKLFLRPKIKITRWPPKHVPD